MIEVLKKHQPIVYQILDNSLKNNRLSHALCFVGSKGTQKLDAALLVAASILCENADGFGCLTCDVCKRVLDNKHTDLIVLDGESKSIKKADVLNLQSEFNKTALEKSGKKVYIINRAENMTVEAGNSLLKFIEEPSSENIIGILIVESLDKLLPTLMSRCQILQFKSRAQEDIYNESLSVVDELDAYLISHFVKNVDKILSVSESESYQLAFSAFKSFIENINSTETNLVELQLNYFRNKDINKEVLSYFIEITSVFLTDVLTQKVNNDSWYDTQRIKVEKMDLDIASILLILLNVSDQISRPFNMSLLIDQMFIKIMEVIS